MGGADIMSKFLYAISIILVVAKIFGLITLSWGTCLLPGLCVIVIKCVLYGWTLGKFSEILEELNEEERNNKNESND